MNGDRGPPPVVFGWNVGSDRQNGLRCETGVCGRTPDRRENHYKYPVGDTGGEVCVLGHPVSVHSRLERRMVGGVLTHPENPPLCTLFPIPNTNGVPCMGVPCFRFDVRDPRRPFRGLPSPPTRSLVPTPLIPVMSVSSAVFVSGPTRPLTLVEEGWVNKVRPVVFVLRLVLS